MDKTLIIKKIKNKFISKKEKYKQFYKEAYSTYSFLKDIADTRYLKPVKGRLRNYQLMILDFGKLWFDKFEELINDISSGLPAEIELRRKQYEYYRNQLLSFKELNNG